MLRSAALLASAVVVCLTSTARAQYGWRPGNDYGMDIDVVPAPSTCAEDVYEPNDSLEVAVPVDTDPYDNLRMCAEDDDYFSIVLSPGDEITVDLTFSDVEGDIDLGLYNPEGTLVASSDSVDDNEQVIYTAETAGTYGIWVHLFADSGSLEGNDYDLDVDLVPAPSTCSNDAFEPNDSFDAAAPVTTGTHQSLRICADDDDFYAIPLAIGDLVTIDLTFLHSEGDIDLGLVDPDGFLAAYSVSNTDNEEVVFDIDMDGDWVIWVDFYEDLGSSEGNGYTMSIVVE